jgi:excisionase family DNA binding protein
MRQLNQPALRDRGKRREILSNGGDVMANLRFEDLPDVMTIQDLKDYLRVGRNKAYEIGQQIPHIKNGNRRLFPKQKVREWLEQQAEQGRLPRRLRAVK